MTEWMGQCFALLDPLPHALQRNLRAGEKLHANDTAVPVLEPEAARPRRADCGLTCVMTGLRPARIPRRCCFATQRTGVVSGRARI